jgi:hypothetical protein
VDEFHLSVRQVLQLLSAFGLSASSAFGQTPAPTPSVAPAESPEASPEGEESASSESSEEKETSLDATEAARASEESPAETVEREPDPGDLPALTDAPKEAPLEDDKSWLKWPFSKENREKNRQGAPHRWASAGGFIGWVHRANQSDSISYRPGIAWGGYLRPELTPWLGLRLFYREERIPVRVEKGAFDYGDDSYTDDFEQPDMEMLNLGARLEPTWAVHPRLRVRGVAGWSWLWFRVPFPKSEDFALEKTFRSAVQMDFSFGAGLSFDIVENWIDISLDSSYSVPGGRTGTAYKAAQIVRDGVIRHIAPMPKLESSLDVLISLGVIL